MAFYKDPLSFLQVRILELIGGRNVPGHCRKKSDVHLEKELHGNTVALWAEGTCPWEHTGWAASLTWEMGSSAFYRLCVLFLSLGEFHSTVHFPVILRREKRNSKQGQKCRVGSWFLPSTEAKQPQRILNQTHTFWRVLLTFESIFLKNIGSRDDDYRSAH